MLAQKTLKWLDVKSCIHSFLSLTEEEERKYQPTGLGEESSSWIKILTAVRSTVVLIAIDRKFISQEDAVVHCFCGGRFDLKTIYDEHFGEINDNWELPEGCSEFWAIIPERGIKMMEYIETVRS